MKEELPLSPEDIGKLRRKLIPILVFPLFVGGIFTAIYLFVIRGGDHAFFQEGFFVAVFGVFGLFFMGVLGYMIWTKVADIRGGVKYRIRGLVTDKRLNIHTTSSHSSGRSRSSTTRHYYLFINNEQFSVDHKVYGRVKVGEQVVMDRAPKSKLTLSLEVVGEARGASPSETLPQDDNRRFLESQLHEVRFNEADYLVLQRAFKVQAGRKLLVLVPVAILVFAMLYHGLQSFLVLFVPFLIIPLWQGVVIMRRLGEFLRNKSYGHKRPVAARIEDKLTVTSNRSQGAYKIATTAGAFQVKWELYDKLAPGENVLLFFPKYGKQPLSVMKLNQEEYYLY